MRVSAAVEDRVFREIKRLSYAGLDSATLRREAARSLERAVPIATYCFFTADPVSNLPTDVVRKGVVDRDHRAFFEHIYFEADVNDYGALARGGRPVALLSEATGESPIARWCIGSGWLRWGSVQTCAPSSR